MYKYNCPIWSGNEQNGIGESMKKFEWHISKSDFCNEKSIPCLGTVLAPESAHARAPSDLHRAADEFFLASRQTTPQFVPRVPCFSPSSPSRGALAPPFLSPCSRFPGVGSVSPGFFVLRSKVRFSRRPPTAAGSPRSGFFVVLIPFSRLFLLSVVSNRASPPAVSDVADL